MRIFDEAKQAGKRRGPTELAFGGPLEGLTQGQVRSVMCSVSRETCPDITTHPPRPPSGESPKILRDFSTDHILPGFQNSPYVQRPRAAA
jgi:hypothetical protein